MSEQKLREGLPMLPPIQFGGFDNHPFIYTQDQMMDFAVSAVKHALSQHEALEPVAEVFDDRPLILVCLPAGGALRKGDKLYTAPPSREVPEGHVPVTVEALNRWRKAFAEELSSWDIDPPLQHVQASHDEIEALLSAKELSGGAK